MLITEVRAWTLNLPLEREIYIGNLRIRERDYVFVEIETDNGLKGHGFGFARGGNVSDCVTANLRPLLVGQDATLTEKLWEEMYLQTRYLGRKGMMMRAISAVDIALWDLKGQKTGLPLWKLLGGMSRKVPAYAAGGYYREGEGLRELREEYARYRDAGFRGVKMKVGAASFAEDLKRIETARETIGRDIRLMVDFNGVLVSSKQALRMAEELKPYEIYFIEEPFLMDNLEAMREFRAASSIPVAIGEDESGRWAFKELLAQKTLDILRHDATLVGGISEWIKVGHLGLAHQIPLYPHWFPEVHIHLAAAMPGCLGVEIIPPETGIMNFHKLVLQPVAQKDGYALAPEEPGLGIRWDWGAIEAAKQKG
ncbi:mandelate racemase/muconate lactonizing enzyme family protein [Paenibacillus sp. GCM10027626]|uniref:mandelate racemase/muconate lactonizing enzyme family protein n=1 Tax=Paenibacillus sp. GCM10027626 TaxID=3273411 RepID=UPI0036270822